ncbi:endonuclease/exonuclease/phosphatase family protein [Actinomycetospora sp. TBRC 11914]|uniref:endonuclease/exonuclease/phosphatase family protein n=1 Tax=Actinomycetospora sp. TBRC 11914 TaxID=2729387 RepID=UPI00145DBE4C|nr:endonuclease/exonuclease/phosphatase family protein [Actinomycetospora sp. TBRC 11914]NMO92674.1 endonuclease [Actinomycetospora sp. TBRC 11914]
MRLATWNVLHGRSHEDGLVDVDRFAAAVATLDVDVLALQEVDRGQPRSHGADLTALAAQALGAGHHRFVPTMAGEPGRWTPAAPPVGADSGWVDAGTAPAVPDGPTFGVALLSRHPVTAWRILRLAPARVALPLLLGRPPRPVLVPDEPRVALAARVAAPGGPVTVVSTHLSFAPGWNLVQLRRVVAALSDGAEGDRLVLLGDLNAGGWPVRMASGLASLAAESTFPSWSPVLQLDHALGRGVTATGSTVHRLPVSDHCALAVGVR